TPGRTATISRMRRSLEGRTVSIMRVRPTSSPGHRPIGASPGDANGALQRMIHRVGQEEHDPQEKRGDSTEKDLRGKLHAQLPQKCNQQECVDEDDIPQYARYGRCDGCQPLLTRYHHGIQVTQPLLLHQLGMVSTRSVPWMRNGVVGT